MLKFDKSNELADIAKNYMPGPHSNLRIPARLKPIFMERGEGAHLIDVDGNVYIDFVCGYGSGILGYGNKKLLEVQNNQLKTIPYLSTIDYRTKLEIDLVKMIQKHHPSAERVRFALGGTEAVQLALRLARGYTGRKYFIRFEGHYHGWLDNVLGGFLDENPVNKPFAKHDPKDFLGTAGRPMHSFQESFKILWNDLDALENTLQKYGDEVAAVMMEPILLNYGCCPPKPGYLEGVQELCTKYGVVLFFDEVQTGFRVGLGSAQGIYDILPDITTFGKALGGGLPCAAVAGKEDIMDQLFTRKVLGAGTFNGYPLGLASALATLKILEEESVHAKIAKLQDRLMKGIKEISHNRGIPMLIQGPTGVFYAYIMNKETQVAYSAQDLHGADHKRQTQFEKTLLEEGILLIRGGRWFTCGGLTDDDIDKSLEIVDKVLGQF